MGPGIKATRDKCTKSLTPLFALLFFVGGIYSCIIGIGIFSISAVVKKEVCAKGISGHLAAICWGKKVVKWPQKGLRCFGQSLMGIC